MREIKFRFWDKVQKKWHSIDSIADAQLLDLEIMQYTGLKDKNGKEIYEGDVIKDTHYYHPLEVKYTENAFWLIRDDGTCYFPREDFREVIGNIYEHGELLK